MSEKNIADQFEPRPPIPEYELESYEPVEFAMPPLGVTDEQVERKMAELAEKFGSEYVDTDRKVVGPKENIEIDIEIWRDGERVENLSNEASLYTVGEGLMPIDFDRNVLGMKVGETKEFQFKAPDFASEDASERLFDAKVKVRKVKKKVVPQITDRWVEKFMPLYKSAEDFRDNIRKQLEESAEAALEQEKNARAAHALAERFKGRIDDYFYEEARAGMMASYEQQAKAQGMDLEDFLGKQGIDQNQFSMMLMMQVRGMLTEGFSLDSWARHYGIEPTEEDTNELANIMSQGRAADFLKQLESAPAPEKEAFEVAVKRYAANKDLVSKSKITFDENAI